MAAEHTKANAIQAERLHRFTHDLRNRLASIHQVVDELVAAGDPQSEALREFAEQQYFRALRATEELLDDLGVDRGISTIKSEAVDLTAVVQRCIGDLDHRFTRKQQKVRSIGNDTIHVIGDTHWLEQLVSALLTNASKFSRSDSTIEVRLERTNGHVNLTVTDQGVGLSAKDLERVFTRYAWLESRSTANEPQGRSTLARAQQWARLHGGTLSASSEGPGKGSTFSLQLPTTDQ